MKPWRNSFVTRWAALFASLIMVVVLVSGWLRDRASRQYFLQDQRRHLANRVEVIRVRVQSGIDAMRKDILYLSSAPAFARLAAAHEEKEREAARLEAGLHIMGGLQVRPTYFQARLIGLTDGGREIIRFDQDRGLIHEVPAQDLQRKGDRDYFLETIKLPPGKFYLSEIDLNQEFGRISEPHIPTLRASTPIFDKSGALFGIVIVNMDLTSVFDELRTLAGPDIAVTLSNSRGDYLLHPNPAKCFGFDLGRRFTLFEDHPELRTGSRHERFEDQQNELSITDEFPFTWEADKSLMLRLALDKGPLLAPLKARRAQDLAVTFALALVAGAVVIGVTNLFARGLRRVAEAVDHYEPGAPLRDLPPDSADEVGLLTRRFRDMAGKISEQMQGLREARQRAESAMRAREEFLAMISHEIRTPMNAVLGMAYLLESEGPGPHQGERLRTLKFAGRHLMALLNNLLDRDRIETGEIVFDRLDFDLRDLLENLQRTLEPLASRKGLSFILAADPGLPPRVAGDPVRLYQVLNNLAHNALKFTERGEIVVRAQLSKADEVVFQISDTGPGLPAPVLETLRTSSMPPATAGLGLRISQRLIELLGGNLETASTTSGTCLSFSLRLPAVSAEKSSLAPEEPPDLAGYSALIVEDVPSNQTVLGAFLGKTRMTTDFVATAARAREQIPTSRYDMAFVDIQLPDANGAELAAALLKMQPDLRIVAVTAQVSPDVRAACEAAGVRAFVPKPIEPAELYDKLRRLTAPRVETVNQMFDYDERKMSEYLEQLDREFKNWETELGTLIERADARGLSRLQHRMKNATGQLGLWKLERTLESLRRAMEQGTQENIQDLGASAARLIATTRQFTGAKRFNSPSR
jgi:signal transduction histidine kinase/DNA-binding NarL/FixJ family response regulator